MRIGGFAALAILLVGLAVMALRAGISIAAQQKGAAGAAIAIANNPDGYSLAAKGILLNQGDPEQAAGLAAQAIRLQPTSVRALWAYAAAEKALGKASSSAQALALAGQGGWRDQATQLMILQEALTQGRLKAAMARAEAIVRVGEQRAPMFQVFRLLGGTPQVEPILVDRLRADPDWRPQFFNADGNIPMAEVRTMARLLTDLAASGQKVKRSEARSTIAMFVNAGETREAWRLFSTLFGPGRDGQLLRDPGFALPDLDYRPGLIATAFDWTLLEGDAGSASIDRSAEFEQNPALFVQARSAANATILAEQSAYLPSGKYTLSYKVRGERDGQAEEMARWVVLCGRDGREIARSTATTLQPGRWNQATLPFAVTTDCGGVRIRLLTASETAFDGAQLWYDDVRIKPME